MKAGGDTLYNIVSGDSVITHRDSFVFAGLLILDFIAAKRPKSNAQTQNISHKLCLGQGCQCKMGQINKSVAFFSRVATVADEWRLFRAGRKHWGAGWKEFCGQSSEKSPLLIWTPL